ncbi:MAG: Tetratricopeptide repeat protein [Clostridia bacterium 62_21]|nr:MAG: Tetratricopeptide repeat protein [Clostridia bacterium 62_21]
MLRRKNQKLVFWVLTVFIGVSLVGSSVVWSGLFSTPPARTEPVPGEERTQASATLEELAKTVEANPQDVSAYLRLGAACLEQGEVDRAVAAYEKVLALDPGNAAARLSLSEIYLAQEKPDEALAQLNAILAADPHHLAALYRRGLLLGLVKGQKDAGAADLERFVRLAGDGPEAAHARSLIAAWRK